MLSFKLRNSLTKISNKSLTNMRNISSKKIVAHHNEQKEQALFTIFQTFCLKNQPSLSKKGTSCQCCVQQVYRQQFS